MPQEELNKNDNEIMYLIPANVSTRFEFFPGFGWKELRACAIAILIGGLIFLLTGFISHTTKANLNDLPAEKKIGLKNNSTTKIEGDIVYTTKAAIPAAIRLFFIIIPGAGAFIAFKKDASTGMSLVESIQSLKGFNKKQKRYLYIYNSASGGNNHG